MLRGGLPLRFHDGVHACSRHGPLNKFIFVQIRHCFFANGFTSSPLFQSSMTLGLWRKWADESHGVAVYVLILSY